MVSVAYSAFYWLLSAGDNLLTYTFFLTDLGYSDVGCFGSEIRTPNIDRIAREGIQFTDCMSPTELVLVYSASLTV